MCVCVCVCECVCMCVYVCVIRPHSTCPYTAAHCNTFKHEYPIALAHTCIPLQPTALIRQNTHGNPLEFTVIHCNTLQASAALDALCTHYSTLQHTATVYSTRLQCVEKYCSEHCPALARCASRARTLRCGVLQCAACVAACCSVLHRVAVMYNMLRVHTFTSQSTCLTERQCTHFDLPHTPATHMQHTAIDYNTLQHFHSSKNLHHGAAMHPLGLPAYTCNTLHHTETHRKYSYLKALARRSSTAPILRTLRNWQHAALHCNIFIPQNTCSTEQHYTHVDFHHTPATHCNTVQRRATYSYLKALARRSGTTLTLTSLTHLL